MNEWMNEWVPLIGKIPLNELKGWLSEWINELLPLNGLINDYPW